MSLSALSPHPETLLTANEQRPRLQAGVASGFAEIYDEYARFIWRTLLRLGVAPVAVEDVVQEVFLVVHRRLPEFEGRSSMRTWIYGIAVRTARNHRRTLFRRRLGGASRNESIDTSALPGEPDATPEEALARAQAAQLVAQLLDQLDDGLREIFVLADIEEMGVPEISEVLGVRQNTVYSRLRAARKEFSQALARTRARDEWRLL